MSDSAKVGRGELLLLKCLAVSCAVVQYVDASHGFLFFKKQSKSPPALSMLSKEICCPCSIHKKVGAVIGLWRRSKPIIHGRMT